MNPFQKRAELSVAVALAVPKARLLFWLSLGTPERRSLPLSARVSRGCWRRRRADAEVPTYLVEAKEAQLPHHIQGTDPGPCGDLSSHLQTDFNDLQRIGENHLGSSSLQEPQGKGNMDGRQECRLLSSSEGHFEALAMWQHFSAVVLQLSLINLHTKDGVFSPESQKEKWLRREEEKEQPLREEELRSEQAEDKSKACLAVDRL